jgi:hypothetical protein
MSKKYTTVELNQLDFYSAKKLLSSEELERMERYKNDSVGLFKFEGLKDRLLFEHAFKLGFIANKFRRFDEE